MRGCSPQAPLSCRSRRHLVCVARNRVLFQPHELHRQQIAVGDVLKLPLSDARAVHIVNVLKLDIGDSLKVGLVDSYRAEARITAGTACVAGASGPAAKFLELQVTSTAPDLSGPGIDLLLALPRPKVLRRLWPTLGELGVQTVVLTGAERVERSFFDAGAALDPTEVEAGLIKGLEQAGATTLPSVVLSRTLRGALRHLQQLGTPGAQLPPPLMSPPAAGKRLHNQETQPAASPPAADKARTGKHNHPEQTPDQVVLLGASLTLLGTPLGHITTRVHTSTPTSWWATHTHSNLWLQHS